jgi:hypothetical protein
VKKGREGKSREDCQVKTVSSGNANLHGVAEEHNDTAVEKIFRTEDVVHNYRPIPPRTGQ